VTPYQLRQLEATAVVRRFGVYTMHPADRDHLVQVMKEMRVLGRPMLRCAWVDGAIYALEGVHRMQAAYIWRFSVSLDVLPPDYIFTEEDQAQMNVPGAESHIPIWAGCDTSCLPGYFSPRPAYGISATTSIAGPGFYDRVVLTDGRSPYSFGGKRRLAEAVGVPGLVLPLGERLRLKDWKPDPDKPTNLRAAAGGYNVTVFEKRGGWASGSALPTTPRCWGPEH
jgi:hypothetical protein